MSAAFISEISRPLGSGVRKRVPRMEARLMWLTHTHPGQGECAEKKDRVYLPRIDFLKSAPGPGFGPIHVLRIASATALPPSVPLFLPATSTVVPVPGT